MLGSKIPSLEADRLSLVIEKLCGGTRWRDTPAAGV